MFNIYTNLIVPDHLVNEFYEDKYFDMIDAIEEAKHIYFKGNNIAERLAANPGKTFRIGETGFGAGRILVSLIDFLNSSDLKNVDIVYNSVELHPITAERMSIILDGFKEKVGKIIEQVVETYSNIDINEHGWHQVKLECSFGVITLNLWIGEALEMVQALNDPCDAWFLDGHGPKKNPEIWRTDLLKTIGEKTNIGGTCATFTVAGFVTRDLKLSGFNVEQCPSFARKRAVLKGIKL